MSSLLEPAANSEDLTWLHYGKDWVLGISTTPAILKGEHSTRVLKKANYGDQQPGKPQVVGKLTSVAPQLSSKDDSHSK